MKLIRSEDGERAYISNNNGIVIAMVEKQKMGTHGHWRGWTHYRLCETTGCMKIVDFFDTDIPFCFANLKEFKAYYAEGTVQN